MSKWRPVDNCIYVIPDIHGAVDLLEKCLIRILPLRNKGGKKDLLIFLGDYIDRHEDSHAVIDVLIELNKSYPDQVICLKGNHEHMLLMGLEQYPNYLPFEYKNQWDMWLYNGGKQTISGYIKEAQRKKIINSDIMLSAINPNLIKKYNLIPDHHLDFMMNCRDFYEIDDFIFVHGGLNPNFILKNQKPEFLYWDRKLFNYVKKSISNNIELPWDRTIICGHSGPEPLFHPRYVMLDGGSPDRLIIFEAHSREAFASENRKSKLVKLSTANSVVKRGSFSRNS